MREKERGGGIYAQSDRFIFFLSPFFYPEQISTGKYNTVLAKGLRDAGLKICAIVSHPLYPDWKPRYNDREIEGIEILRGGQRLQYPKRPIFRRLLLEFWYAMFVARKALSRRNVDSVLAVFPPVVFFPVAICILRKSARRIGIVHDLQSVFASTGSLALKGVLAWIVRWLEGAALKSCHRLVFLSHSMANLAISQYKLDPARCAVHLPFVTPMGERGTGNALVAKLEKGSRHIVYAGALGEKQNPEALIAAFMEMVRRCPDVVFHCFSRGPIADALERRYRDVKGIQFHDLVEERDLPELLDRSDIQVVPQLFGTSEAAIPSKLPNLIAAGVPVLAICDEQSEVGRIVAEAEAGAVVHSWAPEDVADAALKLLDESRLESREARKARAAAYVEKNFNLQRLVNEIVTFVNGR